MGAVAARARDPLRLQSPLGCIELVRALLPGLLLPARVHYLLLEAAPVACWSCRPRSAPRRSSIMNPKANVSAGSRRGALPLLRRSTRRSTRRVGGAGRMKSISLGRLRAGHLNCWPDMGLSP